MRKLVLGSFMLYLFLLIFTLPVYAVEVAVCHIPPGNPNRARTILIPESDVASHERHGDEVFESDECSEGIGECESVGTLLCTPDGIFCDATPGAPLEAPEVSCKALCHV